MWGSWHFRVVAIFAVFYPCFSVADPLYKPHSYGYSSLDQGLNQSYLRNLNLVSEPGFEILGVSDLLSFRQEYEDLNRDYLMRSNFGLNVLELELDHSARMVELTRKIIRRIKSFHIAKERRRLHDLVQRLKQGPLGIVIAPVAMGVAICSGGPMELHIHDNFHVSAWMILPSRTAQVRIVSPYFESSLGIAIRSPDGRDPNTVAKMNPLERVDEKLKFSLTPNLESLGINGELTYLGTSNVVAATFTKRIIDHLKGGITFFYPLDPQSSDIKTSGEVVALFYGIEF